MTNTERGSLYARHVSGTLYILIRLDFAATEGSRYNGSPHLTDEETEAQIIWLGSSRAGFKPKLSDLLCQFYLNWENFQVSVLDAFGR